MIELKIDYSDARKYTNAFIKFIENWDGEELNGLELELLNYLSDDEVGEFARTYYDIEFIDEEV